MRIFTRSQKYFLRTLHPFDLILASISYTVRLISLCPISIWLLLCLLYTSRILFILYAFVCKLITDFTSSLSSSISSNSKLLLPRYRKLPIFLLGEPAVAFLMNEEVLILFKDGGDLFNLGEYYKEMVLDLFLFLPKLVLFLFFSTDTFLERESILVVKVRNESYVFFFLFRES